MKIKNMDASVGATLYIKSILWLNGIRDLSIKEILMQVGLDVDKPFRISLENEYWLKYECEGKTISFYFDNDTLRNDNKKILTFDIINGGVWERFGFFKPEVGKTRMSKIEYRNRDGWPLVIKDKNIIEGKNIAGMSLDEEIHIDEEICDGIIEPFKITLKIGTSIYDSFMNKNGTYIECFDFDVSSSNQDLYYKIKPDAYDKLKGFLVELNYRRDINFIDMYQELCDIYGIKLENTKENYHTNLSIKERNSDGTLSRNFHLEEHNGTIIVRENGLVSTYTREIERGVSHIRRKARNARNKV